MKKYIILYLILLSQALSAQTYLGFLPPRMTTGQRDAISSPAEGLMIYNNSLKCIQYWNSTSWKGTCPLPTPPAPDLSASCNGWSMPYINYGGSASGNVNGVTVTATVTGQYWGKNTYSAVSCGLLPSSNDYISNISTIDNSLTIKFNRPISNLKTTIRIFHINETYYYTFKKDGVIVYPKFNTTAVGCRGRTGFRQSGTRFIQVFGIPVGGGEVEDPSTGASTIFNIGGAWFDEIQINQNSGTSTSVFRFCVGAAL